MFDCMVEASNGGPWITVWNHTVRTEITMQIGELKSMTSAVLRTGVTRFIYGGVIKFSMGISIFGLEC